MSPQTTTLSHHNIALQENPFIEDMWDMLHTLQTQNSFLDFSNQALDYLALRRAWGAWGPIWRALLQFWSLAWMLLRHMVELWMKVLRGPIGSSRRAWGSVMSRSWEGRWPWWTQVWGAPWPSPGGKGGPPGLSGRHSKPWPWGAARRSR